MGTVVDLNAYRTGRTPLAPARDEMMRRLERAVERLESAVGPLGEPHAHPMEPELESELLAILGAIAMEMLESATTRTERLVERLVGAGG
jgi:hypothetical protein